ncbi:MAG: lipoyl domain-containing protein, partial [Planctomycetota bacterium]
MSDLVNVEVPTVGESISEVQIGQWLKAEGDWVDVGEDLVEIETEKASVQIPSPASGVLSNIALQEEEFAKVGDVIAAIQPGEKPTGSPTTSTSAATAPASAPTTPSSPAAGGSDRSAIASGSGFVMPAAQRLLD